MLKSQPISTWQRCIMPQKQSDCDRQLYIPRLADKPCTGQPWFSRFVAAQRTQQFWTSGRRPGSWDFGSWDQEQLDQIRSDFCRVFHNTPIVEDRDHLKDTVPYQSFARTSPPITASPMLRRVPMRKYSANRSLSSGNLAIDFPVRISPTIEGA